jgi:hypothetical protein
MNKHKFFLIFIFSLKIGWTFPASANEIFFSNLNKICTKQKDRCLDIILKRSAYELRVNKEDPSTFLKLIDLYSEFFLNNGDFAKASELVELSKKYIEYSLHVSQNTTPMGFEILARFVYHFSDPESFEQWAVNLKQNSMQEFQKIIYLNGVLTLVFENNADSTLVKSILNDPTWKNSLDDLTPRIIWHKVRSNQPNNKNEALHDLNNIKQPLISLLYIGIYNRAYLNNFNASEESLEKGIRLIGKETDENVGLLTEYLLEMSKTYQAKGLADKTLLTIAKIKLNNQSLNGYFLKYRTAFIKCSNLLNNNEFLESCRETITLGPKINSSMQVKLYDHIAKYILANKKAPTKKSLTKFNKVWAAKDFIKIEIH